VLSPNPWRSLVGTTGFEPATSASRTQRSTRLSHVPSPNPHISRIACCDRGYGRPSGRPRVSDPATYCFSTPRILPPAVDLWHAHLHGLATPTREICGLTRKYSYQKCLALSSHKRIALKREGVKARKARRGSYGLSVNRSPEFFRELFVKMNS
jgi:hypothetical protein